MEDLKFKPLSNFIILDVKARKEKRRGNIIIPETVERVILDSQVIAISEEKIHTATGYEPFVKNVKVGDWVLFDVNMGQTIDIGDKQYFIVRETDLFGILAEKPEPTPQIDIVSVMPPSKLVIN